MSRAHICRVSVTMRTSERLSASVLHQKVRAGIDPDLEEGAAAAPEPKPPAKFSNFTRATFNKPKKSDVIIEKRKVEAFEAIVGEESFVDKARAAAVTFGQDDIKDTINKQSDTTFQVSFSDEADIAFNLMFGMREIRNGNVESGTRFLTKVDTSQFLKDFSGPCVDLGGIFQFCRFLLGSCIDFRARGQP